MNLHLMGRMKWFTRHAVVIVGQGYVLKLFELCYERLLVQEMTLTFMVRNNFEVTMKEMIEASMSHNFHSIPFCEALSKESLKVRRSLHLVSEFYEGYPTHRGPTNCACPLLLDVHKCLIYLFKYMRNQLQGVWIKNEEVFKI